jgi:hypothetical protein
MPLTQKHGIVERAEDRCKTLTSSLETEVNVRCEFTLPPVTFTTGLLVIKAKRAKNQWTMRESVQNFLYLTAQSSPLDFTIFFSSAHLWSMRFKEYPPITYSWTVPPILDHSYLVGNLTNAKIAETKASEPLES